MEAPSSRANRENPITEVFQRIAAKVENGERLEFFKGAEDPPMIMFGFETFAVTVSVVPPGVIRVDIDYVAPPQPGPGPLNVAESERRGKG